MREAIRREIELCEHELATDLARLPGTAPGRRRTCVRCPTLDVTAMVATAEAIMDVPDGPDAERLVAEKRIAETARVQLRMLLVGARNWRSHS